MRESCWSFQYLHVQNGARGCGCLVVVSTCWLERYRDDVIQGWTQASAPPLCYFPDLCCIPHGEERTCQSPRAELHSLSA